MEEHTCPENLRELLVYLEEERFTRLHQEVVTADNLTELLSGYSGRPVQQLQSQILLSRKNLIQGKDILARLHTFGITREEIIASLNHELDLCERCSKKYDDFLVVEMATQKVIGSPQSRIEADSHYLGRYQD